MNDDFLKVGEATEGLRHRRQAELNVGHSRETLEALYGIVYSTEELCRDWEVLGFLAPLVVVRSKLDGKTLGSFEFQHSPRFYFNFQRDSK